MREVKVSVYYECLQVLFEILCVIVYLLCMKILEFIDCNIEINVNKIYNMFGFEQFIILQYFCIFCFVGFVDMEWDGKYIYYSINYEKVGGMVEVVKCFLENFKVL